ncbi:MAG: inositol-3-phosphate synthase, partial [bacterium (Candidatus Stahlbacteria) CG23_combo_of_CG06-09_8_20_14_all_34_7]
LRMEGTTFGNVPLNLELKLEVWDSPNSAGVIIDALRCLKLALDNKLSGPQIEPSSYFMKSAPVQYPDSICRKKTEEYIYRLSKK